MLQMAQVGPGDVLVDLGAGDGVIAIHAAKTRGIQAIGIEYNARLAEHACQRDHQQRRLAQLHQAIDLVAGARQGRHRPDLDDLLHVGHRQRIHLAAVAHHQKAQVIILRSDLALHLQVLRMAEHATAAFRHVAGCDVVQAEQPLVQQQHQFPAAAELAAHQRSGAVVLVQGEFSG